MEVGHVAVEAFCTSNKFSKEKYDFDQEVFNTGLDICHRRVVARFLDLDLSFLDEEEKEGGRAEEGVVGDGAPFVETAEGHSKVAPPLEVVPTSIPAKAMSVSPPRVESEQPIAIISSSSIDPHVEVRNI